MVKIGIYARKNTPEITEALILLLKKSDIGFTNLFNKKASATIAAVIKIQFAGNGKKFNSCII